MRRWFLGFAVLVFAACGASFARADTDYRCLTLCRNGGRIASACLEDCSYAPKSRAVTRAPGANRHNPLEAPAPVDAEAVIEAPPKKEKDRPKDYACMTQCLRDGLQYQMCAVQCAKRDCDAGSAHCKDLTGETKTLPFREPRAAAPEAFKPLK